MHDTQQTVQVKAEQATQHFLEGTEALQARAGEVALRAQRLIHQALDEAPAAGGRAYRAPDSCGEATTAAVPCRHGTMDA